jgi:hypothetical protein
VSRTADAGVVEQKVDLVGVVALCHLVAERCTCAASDSKQA